MRLIGRVLSAAILISAFTFASADEGKARARALFESGTSHYNLTEFKEALGDFKEAYRLTRDSTLLFNIAQCYRQLGDPAAAATFYRSYRREAPDSPNRTEVDRLIEEMDKAAAMQHGPPRETIAPSVSPQPLVAQPAAIPASNELQVSSTVTKKPITKRAWFLAVIGAGALVVAGAAVGIVFGTSPHPPTANIGHVDGN